MPASVRTAAADFTVELMEISVIMAEELFRVCSDRTTENESMFTDIHNHLCYGMDDGPKELSASMALASMAVGQGISEIISTPHVFPGVHDFSMEKYTEHLTTLQRACEEAQLPLKLYAGAEIFYTEATPHFLAQEAVPTLAGTRYVLIEFSPDTGFAYILRALERVAGAGYEPIVAHAERYAGLRRLEDVRTLREHCGAKIQVNASTVEVADGFLRGRWLWKMLDRQYVDFIATDAHDAVRRPCRLQKSADILTARFGEDYAQLLLRDNARAILDSERW